MLNIRINVVTQREVLAHCIDFLSSGVTNIIFFLNAHCINIAQQNPEYFRAIDQADLLLNDGIGVRIASWFSGISFPDNLNGTDLIPQILGLAAREGSSVFFLGGAEGVALEAASRSGKQIPELLIAGAHHGFFQPEDFGKLVQQINDSNAQVLVLGMGVPKQELWTQENKHLFPKVRIIIAGGAILDFISGKVKRAPLWMRKINAEWLFRLMLEPDRMGNRYLLGGFRFFYYVLKLSSRKSSKRVE